MLVVVVVLVVLVELVLVVVVGVVVVAVVVVGGGVVELVVGVDVLVELVVPCSPLSDAITTRAMASPSASATTSATAILAPRLILPGGVGSSGPPAPGGGWPMRRVGSSCTARVYF